MIGKWQLAQLKEQFGGEITKDQPFTGVSTDTRTIKAGDVFVALVGPNFNGHAFIQAAIEKGAVAVVVSEPQQVKQKTSKTEEETRIFTVWGLA